MPKLESIRKDTFLGRLFSYPSNAWLSLQTFLILVIMTQLSWFLSVAAAVICCILLLHRVFTIMTGKPSPFSSPKNVFITGGSSGIGEYLAYRYLREGAESIYITGRNQAKLDAVQTALNEMGKEFKTFKRAVSVRVDVIDKDAMRTTIESADDECGGLDVVIANAGLSASVLPDGLTREEMTRTVFDVNVTGVLNTVFPALDRMQPRKRGQLVLVASIAGIAALPGNNPYAATKAALISYGLALRQELARVSPLLGVTVVNPGFVKSELTRSRYERVRLPFLMETDDACALVYNAICENLAVITFPLPTYIGGWLMRVVPFPLHNMVSSFISEWMYPSNINDLPVKSKDE